MNPKSKSFVSGNHRCFIKTVFTLTALMLFALGAMPARAAVKIWDGSSSALWSVGANWSGGVAPANGDDLVFPDGTPRVSITNNYAAIRLKSIVFTTVTGLQYSVYGNPIVVSNNISSQSPAFRANFLKMPITSGKNQIFSCDNANAVLLFEGDLDLGATTVTDIGSGSLDFFGSISGTGGITKNGTGLMYFDGGSANTYTGPTVINAGVLFLNSTVINGTIVGPLIIGDGIGGANADKVYISRVRQIGNTVPVTINSSGLLDIVAGKSDAFGTLSGSGNVVFEGSNDLEVGLDDGSSTFSGVISGDGNFWKHGTGTMTLSGNNTYTGLTIIYGTGPADGGTLLVNGSQPLSTVIISNGCTLGGSGTVGNTMVASGGRLAPGASTGKLTVRSNLVLAAGSTSFFELNKAANTNDSVAGLTNMTYGGALVVTNISGTFGGGENYQLFAAASYSGAFSSLTLPVLNPGLIWTNKLLVNGSIEVLVLSPGDRFWTNLSGGNYDVAANWLDSQPPLAADTAAFTSNASYQVMWAADALAANAYFNASSGTVTQAIGSASWTLTNSYIVGRDVGATSTVAQISGTLNVTNAASNAVLEARRGTLRINGGIINTVRLLATNSAGKFVFNGGTLITRGGTVSNGVAFAVGVSGNIPAVLDVRSNQPLVLDGLYLGSNSPNNTLFVTNGGQLVTGNYGCYVGLNTSSSNNLALVAGPNSIWTNSQGLVVGDYGSFNQLIITNGGKVVGGGILGEQLGSSYNLALVTGTNSIWTNAGSFVVGGGGSFNQLIITNGGKVVSQVGGLGDQSGSSYNLALVTGTNSTWTNSDFFIVGLSGGSNQLIVTNGGKLEVAGFAIIGYYGGGNQVLVTGNGSSWTNRNAIGVGDNGSDNTLIVNNGGSVVASNLLLSASSGSGNTVIISGGDIIISNLTHVRNGTLELDSGGLLRTDTLRKTGSGALAFNGGTLQTRITTNNGPLFVVGDGVSSASFELLGNGTHSFAAGLTITNNALLKGNGTIIGNVTNASGGTISVGTSIGTLIMSSNLVLAAGSTNIFEISKTANTNDNIVGLTSVTYGGTLVVTNLAGTPVGGENYKLFSASSYSGAFSALSAPSPGAGLAWDLSRLPVDGVLSITSAPPLSISQTSAGTTNLVLNATGVPFNPIYLLTSTNVALPVTNWTYLATNYFDVSGNASFTNIINAAIPGRYYRLSLQ